MSLANSQPIVQLQVKVGPQVIAEVTGADLRDLSGLYFSVPRTPGDYAITVFAKAVKSFADLNRNLDVFQATAGATADEMDRVREASIKLGADLTLPSVSAGDAAGAMVELAKAGLSVRVGVRVVRAGETPS